MFRKLAGALLFTALLAPPVRAQSDTAWNKLYLRDLDSLRAAIAANHPGVIDAQNPEFARTLERAYADARRLASKVDDFASFQVALTRFIDQFEDQHLQVGFTRQMDSLREAGIIVKYDQGAFVVVDVHNRYGNSSRLLGAKVDMCEGIPADRIFRNRVLWWLGREKIEADWHRRAPLFFVDYGPPTPRAPRACSFDVQGSTIIQQLQWRTTARADFNAVLQQTFRLAQRNLGTKHVGARALWVGLPTFNTNSDSLLTVMRATLDSLRTFLSAQPEWQLLVFDLRNNSGGSSTWGDEIAKIVFGESWIEQATSYLYDGVYTEWRLSPENLRSMRELQQQIAQREGAESTNARNFKTFVDSAEAELARGIKYYGTRRTVSNAPKPAPVAVPGKIAVITTTSCFSACLDFLDRMRLHPAVVHVGQTTGVDTNYMENTGGAISELTTWTYPMKVYRNRKRAMNEAYKPQVPYAASLEDDQALRDWILENYKSW
ncbi:MAG TPA: S41 family peptidase [Longimicrobiales bacterium]